jgi:hypothetical protein
MCGMAFIGAPPLNLQYLGGRQFELMAQLRWQDPADGSIVTIPPGTFTDLASVPPFLWGLVASYGRQALPAILHDHLSDVATSFSQAREADHRFHVALREEGIPDVRAAAMWAAVGLGSWVKHRGALGLLFVAVMVLGVAAIVGGVVLGVLLHPLWLLLMLAPLPLALVWGREAGLQVTATYLFALYSPLIITAAILSGLDYVVAFVLWVLRGFRGNPPTPGPTIRRKK